MAQADGDKMKVFTGRANPQLAERICKHLNIDLGRGRTELFPDGELIVRVEEDVRGRDCFVVQPTSHPVNAHLMGGEIGLSEKRRKSGTETTAMHIIGDVQGKNVLMVDDMITTAGTMTEAVRILRENGALDIYISSTHAVFAPPAMERLAN